MAKANAEATAERVDHLQGMILAGEPNTACLTYARQSWGVSRSQGYRLLKRAWRQIHDDIEGPDLDRQQRWLAADNSLYIIKGFLKNP